MYFTFLGGPENVLKVIYEGMGGDDSKTNFPIIITFKDNFTVKKSKYNPKYFASASITTICSATLQNGAKKFCYLDTRYISKQDLIENIQYLYFANILKNIHCDVQNLLGNSGYVKIYSSIESVSLYGEKSEDTDTNLHNLVNIYYPKIYSREMCQMLDEFVLNIVGKRTTSQNNWMLGRNLCDISKGKSTE